MLASDCYMYEDTPVVLPCADHPKANPFCSSKYGTPPGMVGEMDWKVYEANHEMQNCAPPAQCWRYWFEDDSPDCSTPLKCSIDSMFSSNSTSGASLQLDDPKANGPVYEINAGWNYGLTGPPWRFLGFAEGSFGQRLGQAKICPCRPTADPPRMTHFRAPQARTCIGVLRQHDCDRETLFIF